MRDCMVLPIIAPSVNAIEHQTFLLIEQHLKKSTWCYYRTNSEVLNILANYQYGLKEHLQNPQVLELIADKTHSGSLIKIILDIDAQGSTTVDVQVISENGKDLYFKEKTQLKSPDVAMIAQTINNWLDVYGGAIPFDGVVTGVLGQQFTLNIGKNLNVKAGDNLEIVRPTRKRMHPLLKEVVEWETQYVGGAKVQSISIQQAVGSLDRGHYEGVVKIGDWVKVVGGQQKKNEVVVEEDEEESGKLGQIRLGLSGDQGLASSNYSGKTLTLQGLHYSLQLVGDLWIMRHIWLQGSFSKGLGTYNLKDGQIASFATSSISTSSYRVVGGYKYLPLGFFYGPQVDFYLGFGSYSYSLDYNPQAGFSDSTFRGALLGIRGEVPIYQKIRPFIRFELLVNPDYVEDAQLYGKRKTASSYLMNAGLKYEINSFIEVMADWFYLVNDAKFTDLTTAEINFRNNGLGISGLFSF